MSVFISNIPSNCERPLLSSLNTHSGPSLSPLLWAWVWFRVDITNSLSTNSGRGRQFTVSRGLVGLKSAFSVLMMSSLPRRPQCWVCTQLRRYFERCDAQSEWLWIVVEDGLSRSSKGYHEINTSTICSCICLLWQHVMINTIHSPW